jgi:hypothetical protein
MARASITVQTGTGKYPTLAQLDPFAFTACDASNFNECDFTGREVIIAYNSSADTAYDFTVESLASQRTGRTLNLVKEIPFGEHIVIGPLGVDGFRQANGKLYFTAENAAILVGIVRLA